MLEIEIGSQSYYLMIIDCLIIIQVIYQNIFMIILIHICRLVIKLYSSLWMSVGDVMRL